jgi:hypothetical protein
VVDDNEQENSKNQHDDLIVPSSFFTLFHNEVSRLYCSEMTWRTLASSDRADHDAAFEQACGELREVVVIHFAYLQRPLTCSGFWHELG